MEYLQEKKYNVDWTEDYIIAEGNLPICLIAHMDTVFHKTPEITDFLYDAEKHILWSPAGSGFDDRTGIYIIIEMIERGFRPSIIFTDLEEHGGIGAQELVARFPHCPFKKCNCLIELDRANKNDMVFYDCDNPDFIKYIGKFGFKEEFGSFTDISFIAQPWGLAAVNLSVGYLDQHTIAERLNTKWCDLTILKLDKILRAAARMKKYKYVPFVPPYMENKNRCLICNKKLGKNDKYFSNINYIICEECFNKYYEKR